MSLQHRWVATLERLGRGPAAELWQAIAKRYREPERAYHTLHHIAACFVELDASGMAASPALELAIFFHDVIYDPRSHDNEEQSARFAARSLAELGVPAGVIADVSRLVLATKHAHLPIAADEQLIVDIDLSILGTEAATFDVYEREVRQEYGFVPDQAFESGRSAILQSFLGRPAIFATPWFQARYEARARRNLERSIQRLETARMNSSTPSTENTAHDRKCGAIG